MSTLITKNTKLKALIVFPKEKGKYNRGWTTLDSIAVSLLGKMIDKARYEIELFTKESIRRQDAEKLF